MSQAQSTAPARSDPPSGTATPSGSEPNPNSKSAGESLGLRINVNHGSLRCTAKKEAKRLEKEAKLAAKAAKAAPVTPAGEKKAKEKSSKSEEAFVNTTPKGEKKGAFTAYMLHSANLTQLL
jgi:valyl-tRNA synthetase